MDRRPLSVVIVFFLLLNLPAAARAQRTGPLTAADVADLVFRELGPAVTGGRVHDVEAVPGRAATVYVGAASGGVWRSYNGGTTWTPLWDDLPNSSVGDIALAPSDPRVVYVGTGGPNNRQSTLYGNGVWKSVDAGDTWTHLGLRETRHIGRIRVHPTDPEVVYVAALGDLWGPNEERGVFRSTDGGRTWRKVLYVDEHTGAVDLVMDPADPRILYAATYQRERRTWGFAGGGPGGGIWKTTDGGDHWTRLVTGLPEGDLGRIGLAVAATAPNVLVATVEHASAAGVYRTEDGGGSWERVSRTNPRPMYYSHIYIDPTDADRVYVLGTSSYTSADGGRNFSTLPTQQTYDVGVHADHHALWIDPADPEHLILGGDAGIYVSWDRGTTFTRFNNLAIGQFYAVGVDLREPYNVYGGLQDNHSWMGPSRTRRFIGIVNDDWHQIGFSDGIFTQPDPVDNRTVYLNSNNGSLSRFDNLTGSSLGIRPEPPEGEERYRWDWAAPVLISPHDHRKIYTGANRLFVSEDRGDTWRRTVDLTRAIDRDTLPLMGSPPGPGILSRHDGASSYGEITTIDESPIEPGLVWVGTDDGLVQVSRDDGRSWTEVGRNISGVPEMTYVSRVSASAHEPRRAYVSFDGHRDADRRPYVFLTDDLGASWRRITDGLAEEGSVNVVKEHPRSPDLLFAGTEHVLYFSLDRGRHWLELGTGLPTAPVDDLVIHPRDDDLVVGTHGRSIWVLEDLTPLREFSAEVADQPVHLFGIRSPLQYQKWKATSYRGHGAFAAPQPHEGAVINYWLAAAQQEPVSIQVITPEGRLVSRLEGPATRGLHRVVWDLRLEPPASGVRGGRGGQGGSRSRDPNLTDHLQAALAARGPLVIPGRYIVRLTAAGLTIAQEVVVRPDPMDPLSPAQRTERWAFLLGADDLQRTALGMSEHLDGLRERAQASATAARTAGLEPLAERLGTLAEELRSISTALSGQVRRGATRLLSEFAGSAVRQGSLEGPTGSHREQLNRLMDETRDLTRRFERLERERIGALDRELREAGLPTIGG